MQRINTEGGTDVSDLKYMALKRLLKSRGVEDSMVDAKPGVPSLVLLGVRSGVLTREEAKEAERTEKSDKEENDVEEALKKDLEGITRKFDTPGRSEKASPAKGGIAVNIKTREETQLIHVRPADDVLETVRSLCGNGVTSVLLGTDIVEEGTFCEWGAEEGATLTIVEGPDFEEVVGELMEDEPGLSKETIIEKHFGITFGESFPCTSGAHARTLNEKYGRNIEWDDPSPKWSDSCEIYRQVLARKLPFPPPNHGGLDINMMPFKIANGDKWGRQALQTALPESLHPYIPLLCECRVPARDYQTNIMFITVTESRTSKGKSQRRGGLHTEAPGDLQDFIEIIGEDRRGDGSFKYYGKRGGRFGDGAWTTSTERSGGIYMASNCNRTCEVFNAKVTQPGALGDSEHLRMAFPRGTGDIMMAGDLMWMTDQTPHESLPVKTNAHRQFFRLVTGTVSQWHSQHCTPNPLGTVPDPAVTTVVHHNKFEGL